MRSSSSAPLLLLLVLAVAGPQGVAAMRGLRRAAREEPAPDTGAGEITDQGDPEFKMLAQDGKCIREDDVKRVVEEQFASFKRELEQALKDPQTPEPVKQQIREHAEMFHQHEGQVMDMGLCMWRHADRLETEDGCVSKAEFDKANDMERPPPEAMEECFGVKAAEHGAERAPEVYEHDDDDHDHDGKDDAPTFEDLDQDGNNEVTFPEVQAWADAEAEGPRHEQIPSFVLEAIFAFTDVEPEDDVVTRDEFEASMKALETPEGQEKLHKLISEEAPNPPTGEAGKPGDGMARAEFEMMDQNMDEYLSEQEVFDYANNSPHLDISAEKVSGMFDAFDTTDKEGKEGKDGLLSFEEFISAGENYEGDGDKLLLLAKAQKKKKVWRRVSAWRAARDWRAARKAGRPAPVLRPDLASLRRLVLVRHFGSLRKTLGTLQRKARSPRKLVPRKQ